MNNRNVFLTSLGFKPQASEFISNTSPTSDESIPMNAKTLDMH